MENDLIRRSDALTEFEKVCNVCVALVARPMCDECSVADTVRTVKHIPAVDAVPVVHGNWIYRWNQYFRQELPYCSVCEKVSPSVSKTEYCPHCGAKMDALAKDINVHCKTDEVTE